LLDITPNAVDHLNYAQYFPICIYLKATSRNHTKELRQKYAKNLKAKSSKRLYDNAVKLETHYAHLFTAVMTLDSNQWFKKLKEIIDLQQNQPVWISEDLDKQLTACEAQQEEDQKQQIKAHEIENSNQQNQQQVLQNGQIVYPSSMGYPGTNIVFDDNFEFPLYTAANQPFSMSGAASSTYSLYEESANYNRSSFAASDSDICGTSVNYQTQQKMLSELNHQQQMQLQQQQQMASIYSTNFNNKPSQQLTSNANANGFASNNGLASTSSSQSSNSTDVMSGGSGQGQSYMPNKVKSESSLMTSNNCGNTYDHLIENGNGLDIQQHYQQQQQQQQHCMSMMNPYEMSNASQNNQIKPNFYNSNEIDLQRSLLNQHNAAESSSMNNDNSNANNNHHPDNNASSIFRQAISFPDKKLNSITIKFLRTGKSSPRIRLIRCVI
jgi:hypothetical protein